MADAAPAIPPLDRMFLIGIWIETVLYGMNCIAFFIAFYVLIHRKDRATPSFLTIVACWLFILSTAHVALVLRQLLEAFIYGPPGDARLYFANQASPIPVAKLLIYITNVFSQDLILIWRLWIVWSKSWKIIVLPLVVEAVHIAAGYRATARGAQPGVAVFDSVMHTWAIVTWTLDLVVNVGVTAMIVYKLHQVGRGLYGTGLSRKNRYTSVIFMIVESGTLFASATIVVVSLYLSNNIAVVVALDSVIQLATLTPLLIIVRVRLGLTHGPTTKGSIVTPKAFSSNTQILNIRPGVNISTSVEYELSPLSRGKDTSGERLV